jgi:hypothetical protein
MGSVATIQELSVNASPLIGRYLRIAWPDGTSAVRALAIQVDTITCMTRPLWSTVSCGFGGSPRQTRTGVNNRTYSCQYAEKDS